MPGDIPCERDELAAPDNEAAVEKRELVERAGRGDHDAFATLVGTSIGRLDAAARLILRDPDLARDAVQDGFLKAWRSSPTLRDPERFDAWLRWLVVRVHPDHIHDRRFHAMVSAASRGAPLACRCTARRSLRSTHLQAWPS